MATITGPRAIIALLVLVLTSAAAQNPPTTLPPLVPCEGAEERTPCVETVSDIGEIVGVWRRYYQGATAMAFTEFREDGTFSIVQELPGDDRVSGIVRFEEGVASFVANPDGPAPAECKAAGAYELRLVRVGEQPVVLSFHLLNEDQCAPRVGDFRMPMVFYDGTGEGLAMTPDAAAVAQPLVPCPEAGDAPYPCDLVVAHAGEAAGIWRQYVGRPDLMAPGGMGYQRINPDGRFVIADLPENTVAPYANYPYGTFVFEDGEVQVTVDAAGIPPMCATATHRFHVYRYGAQPVALLVAPIEDECAPRLQDMNRPIIWVGDVD
jgi:hypothetical protein